jgi:hypothetical protein
VNPFVGELRIADSGSSEPISIALRASPCVDAGLFTTEDTEDTEETFRDDSEPQSHANLEGENADRSCSGLRPSMTAAITSAVTGARRMPSRKCPVAMK